jgi:hypothetical protein
MYMMLCWFGVFGAGKGLLQEAAPGGDLGWQSEDCDFYMGTRG